MERAHVVHVIIASILYLIKCSVLSVVCYYKNKINNIKYTIKGKKREKPSRNHNASLILRYILVSETSFCNCLSLFMAVLGPHRPVGLSLAAEHGLSSCGAWA